MKICFVAPYYDARRATPDHTAYLEQFPIHSELPRAVAALGHTVDVVYHYPYAGRLERDGVRHWFEPPGVGAHQLGRLAQRFGREAALFTPAISAARRGRALAPDIVHAHGLVLTWNLFWLRMLGARAAPLVLHYHGGYPATQPLARLVQRANVHSCAMSLFTTKAHAEPFVQAGMLRPEQIAELIETSSHFAMLPQHTARQITGMVGNPVVLSAGRLDPIKDPFTMLRGFEQVAAVWPQARLYLFYLTNDLEPQMRAWLEERPALAERVIFRGRAPLAEMEAIYSSADFVVQASLREFSGCAILEAMSCGAIPILSDIPSFRRMTNAGMVGRLFPVGESAALAHALLSYPRETLYHERYRTRAWFEQELSFAAMAAQLERIYCQLA
ncbi:MAG: glycosyltransferase family 4 protein [Roseiflexaceae bacterium]